MSDRVKIELEFPMRTSSSSLFYYLDNPGGLSDWFADNVSVVKDIYTFSWDGDKSKAKKVRSTRNKSVKFSWVDGNKNEYFEFELLKDGLTNDINLIITDWTDKGEEDDFIDLWEAQIETLKSILGA